MANNEHEIYIYTMPADSEETPVNQKEIGWDGVARFYIKVKKKVHSFDNILHLYVFAVKKAIELDCAVIFENSKLRTLFDRVNKMAVDSTEYKRSKVTVEDIWNYNEWY